MVEYSQKEISSSLPTLSNPPLALNKQSSVAMEQAKVLKRGKKRQIEDITGGDDFEKGQKSLKIQKRAKSKNARP